MVRCLGCHLFTFPPRSLLSSTEMGRETEAYLVLALQAT